MIIVIYIFCHTRSVLEIRQSHTHTVLSSLSFNVLLLSYQCILPLVFVFKKLQSKKHLFINTEYHTVVFYEAIDISWMPTKYTNICNCSQVGNSRVSTFVITVACIRFDVWILLSATCCLQNISTDKAFSFRNTFSLDELKACYNI